MRKNQPRRLMMSMGVVVRIFPLLCVFDLCMRVQTNSMSTRTMRRKYTTLRMMGMTTRCGREAGPGRLHAITIVTFTSGNAQIIILTIKTQMYRCINDRIHARYMPKKHK